jgi:hypothetical protein
MADDLTMAAGLGGASQPAGPLPATLEELTALARTLEPPAPHERSGLLRDECAFLLDGLLVRVAHARSALDVAIGELLADLDGGQRVIALGFSGVADYGREVLDLGESTARNLARLARALRERPLLRRAVWRGGVSTRKAETILSVARGDAEGAWVERARTGTVRALRDAMREAAGTVLEPDERWSRLEVELTPDQRIVVDEALELAGKVLERPGAPRWQKLEAVCCEYLAEHPIEAAECDHDPAGCFDQAAARLGEMKAWLEQEHQRWSFLEAVPPVPAAEADADVPPDAEALDARLRELGSRRAGWDALVGHLAMLVRMTGLWRDMRFASFAHYCEERLGMSERNVEQRIALARKLYELPALRDALAGGCLSYGKAREIARIATGETEGEWIARAEGSTCIALRREVDAREEAQLCSERRLCVVMPERVRETLAQTVRAVRKATGRWVSPGEALAVAAVHFIRVWRDRLRERSTPRRQALARDRWRCTAPGCSRTAVHVHHVEFRSRGGSDDLANLTSLCAAHHLVAIHGGLLRLTGMAPDGLSWALTH